MDSNYLYMRMSEQGEEHSNAGGDFFKNLFKTDGRGKDFGKNLFKTDEGEFDSDKAVGTGMALLGIFSAWNQNRKNKKNQGAYTEDTQPPPPNNTALYVLGGLAVVGIGVSIYFITRKK